MAEESEASVADVLDHNDTDSILLMMKMIDSYMNQELSYNQLEDEAKQVFLLCGVHGPSLLVSDLLKYVIGLGVFKHVTSVDDARSKLDKILVDLEKSSLLEYNARVVKVSALLCRVASIIVSTNHNTFTTDTLLKRWPGEDFFASCTQIILKCCSIQILPQRLNCPNLYFLYLGGSNDNHIWEIPPSFFEGVGNLQVLVLIGMTIPSLPASLISLVNLKTLCFNDCFLQDLVGIGGLKSLEILSFFKSSMKELPSDIGQLSDHLRMLDLSSSKIEVIPPKIISNLNKLEELYMGAMQKKHDILDELMHLTSLTALELQIPEGYILPCSMISEKLKRYNIVIGDQWEWSDSNEALSLLKLKLDPNIHLEKEIKAMVESAEYLYLEINGLEVIRSDEQLAVDQLSEKIKVMKAKSCGRLEYLFSFSKINKFSQLVEIEVSKCSSMNNIVLLDSGTTIDEIESIPMRSLTLQHLPAIHSFCSDDSGALNIPTLFPNEKALFRDLEHLKLISISRIMLLVITTPSNGMVPLRNLETMEIGECNDLQYLFVIEGRKMHENDGGLLPALCRLHLLKLDKLRSIVGLNHPTKTLSFKMLKHLTVCSCKQLRYLLPLYVIENLQQLEEIEIKDCKLLERVFGDEEEGEQMIESNETKSRDITVQLPQVMSLILKELPKLSGFCQDGCLVEWLSLKTVRVAKCDMMKESSLGKIARPLLKSLEEKECNGWANDEDTGSNIEFLFESTRQPIIDMVTIEDSEELKKNMELPPLSFKQLKNVEASQCDNELNKFFSILLNQSYKLEQLKVENCELLEQVFDLKEFVGKGQNLKFPNLDTMQLHGLPNLKCIWNKDPTGIVGLGKLVKLEIIKCGLRKGPLSNTLVEKLVQLKELRIESCKMLEKVVEDGTEMQEKSFRSLQDLQLASLPMLIKFNSGNCNFQFPNLQSLRIEKCPELNAFTAGFLSRTTDESTSNPVPSNAKMQGACSKLQTLKLVGHESFEKIWEGLDSNIPECQLKDVEVDSFSKLIYIFPSSMVPTLSKKLERLVVMNCSSLRNLFQLTGENDSIKGFQNLKSVKLKGCESIESLSLPSSCPELTKIDISDCPSLMDIFIDTEIKADDKCFPNLESIVLQNLPMLSSFSLEISDFPKLKKVRIVKCPAIKTFSRKVPAKTDSSESRPFGHGKTILLSQLQELELGDLPNMQLWNQEPQIPVFKNLTTLKVISCGSIGKLFSISVAQHLTSLKWLTLYKCGNMVQVLGGDGGGKSIRVFHKLETLVLKHLPRLTSFCEEDVDFGEFPELKMLRVENVPKMYTFVRKPLKTPKLKQVHVTFIKKCWRQNLNRTIEHLHENHDKLRHEVWESDQINGGLHTDAAKSSSQDH